MLTHGDEVIIAYAEGATKRVDPELSSSGSARRNCKLHYLLLKNIFWTEGRNYVH